MYKNVYVHTHTHSQILLPLVFLCLQDDIAVQHF